ncbi:MAG: NAD(P)-binding domain-containing protein [Phycisphaerales bacterium]|jgi:thioredoxin reductase (NADPH)|nr:NAD(P)-binding domain-containing protein [Phycisphaerales bacterium]
MNHVETIIIGAGPIGLETAIGLKERGMPFLHFDAGAVGQQVLDFPAQSRWFSSPERLSIAGVPFVTASHEKGTREEYLAYLRSVVGLHALSIRTFEKVVEVMSLPRGGFEIGTRTRAGLEHRFSCDRLVIATGGTARPRTLGIPGEDLPHVSHFLQEPHRTLGRRVLVVGGRNSACDTALRAFRCGADVTISYRGQDLHERVKYWVRPELSAMIKSAQVRAHFETVPIRIERDSVHLKSVVDETLFEVPVDDVILEIGYEADNSLFAGLGAKLDEQQAVVHDPGTMETTVPGLYVAGTAVAGTQHRFKVYIENSHVHAHRIVAAFAGEEPPGDPVLPLLPES